MSNFTRSTSEDTPLQMATDPSLLEGILDYGMGRPLLKLSDTVYERGRQLAAIHGSDRLLLMSPTLRGLLLGKAMYEGDIR
jgi:hypothetical protein